MAYTATINKLSEGLKLAYENTIFFHSGDIGDSREKVVIEYLKKVMANKYGFCGGEIFDFEDNNSGQVDIIMYDNLFSTVFTDGSGKVLAPVESTYGIISVKSKMGTKELNHAIEGIKKYNSLKRPTVGERTLQILPDYSISLSDKFSIKDIVPQQNINCIFAFNTTLSAKTLLKKVQESGIIDLVVVPNAFCVIGRHRNDFGLNDNGKKIENELIETDNSICLFTLFLQILFPRNRLKSRDVKDLIIKLAGSSTRKRMKTS